MAIRLTKQLRAVMGKIKYSIHYNTEGGVSVGRMPLEIKFDDLKEPEYISNVLQDTPNSVVAPSVKRQAVHLQSLVHRCVEEQLLVIEEMKCCINWYLMQHYHVVESLPKVNGGHRALLLKEGLHLEVILQDLKEKFRSYIPDIEIPILTSFRELHVGIVDMEDSDDSSDDIEPVDSCGQEYHRDCTDFM